MFLEDVLLLQLSTTKYEHAPSSGVVTSKSEKAERERNKSVLKGGEFGKVRRSQKQRKGKEKTTEEAVLSRI